MKTFSFSHCASHRGFIPIRSTNNSRSIRAKRFNAVFCAAWQCVEALESRTLLSSVSGTVYSDLNLSGSRSTGDPGLAGIQVFDDLNGTGQYQAGDPSATTASDGSYVMYNVPLNTPQIICVSLPTGWDESTADDGTTSVTLTSAARHVTDVDFGLWQPITGISAQDINLDEGQAFTGSVATVTDSAGGYADPNNYSGTLTLNGTSAVGFELDGDGNLIGQPANFPNLSVGTYGAEVDVTESDNGHSFSGSAQFTVTVNGVPISAQGASSSAQTGIPWTGTIATFTDPDPNAAIGNYSASINYGDGTTPSAGTISYDGSGGWVVTDTHTFATDETFTPTVTIDDSAFAGDTATATSTIAVSLAPVSLSTPTVELTEGDSFFNGVVGTLTDSARANATGNYSGTLAINGSAYGVSFSNQGSGNYSVASDVLPTLAAGSYSATLDVTETGQTSSVSASSTLAVIVDDTPYTNVTPVNISAYAGVAWTGTVATFDHGDLYPQAGNYSATIAYAGGSSPGTISSDGSGGWIVTATLMYANAGNDSPVVTINDYDGSSVSVSTSAAVTFAPLSLSASNLDLEQGQSFNGNIGLLSDAAGSYSNPANFSASLTWDGWIYGNLSFSADPAGPGMWDIVASGLPALAAGNYSNSLSVTETGGGQSLSTDPVSFSVAVIPPALYASGQYISATVNQSWSGTLANVSDDDPYDQPSVYDTASTNYGDGSAASDGQVSTESSNEWTVSDTHTFIAAGTFTPQTTISDSSGNVLAGATSTANVNLASISLATSDVWLYEGQWLGTFVGTLSDQAGGYATGNYSGTLTVNSQTYSVSFVPDGSGDGLYDAEIASPAPLALGEYTAVLQASESSSDGQTVGATSSFGVNVTLLPLSPEGVGINANVGASWSGTVATFANSYIYASGSYYAPTYSATIDYGDGTAASAGTVTSDGNYGWIVTDTHAFPSVGTFDPTVTLNDLSNGNSYTANDSATIADVPPTLADDSPASVTGIEGQSFTGTLLHFNDANPYAQPSDFTAAIDWGDGSSDSQDSNISIVSDPNGGFDVVGTHTFASMNTYNVTVTATDPSGESVSNTVAATIAPITSTFTATPVNTGAIDLEWSLDVDPGTVSNIEVDRSTSPTSGFAAVPAAQYLPGDSVSYIDDNPPLTEGTQYYYELQVSIAGETYTSPVVNAWTPPAALSGLAATVAGPNEVDLTWTNDIDNADAIYVSRAPAGTTSYNVIATLAPNATGYPDTSVLDNTGYTYVVSQSVAGVSSDDSNAATATTRLAPPTDVQASGYNTYGYTYVALTWTNESSQSPSFAIERQDPVTGVFGVVGNVGAGQDYGNDADLTDGATYTYEIVADKGGTLSAPSAPVTVTVPPDPPSSVVATANGATEVDLSWTNDATISTGVQILRSTDGETFIPVGQPLPADATIFKDKGLVSDTPYYYEVAALSGSTPSQLYNNEAFAQTAAVAGVNAVAASTGEIDLSWSLYVTDATSIEVDRSTDDQTFTPIATGLLPDTTTLPDTDPALVEGTEYYYRLDITEGSGSAATTVLTPGTPVWTLPSAPAAVTASDVSANVVDLTWTNTSAGADGFQILRSNPDGSYGLISTFYGSYAQNATVTYADQAAPDGTTSTYEVETIGGGDIYVDDSAASDPSNPVTTPLAAPSGLSAQAASSSQIDLFWTNNSTTASGVEIDRSTTGAPGSFSAIATVSPSPAEYADTGLAEGTHYYYQIEAVNGSIVSPSITADASTDAAVDTLTATPASTSEIDLSWNLNTIAATAIEVDRSTDGGSAWTMVTNTLPGTAVSFDDTGLSENTTYTYQVRAIEGANQSAFTTPVTAATWGAISGLSATTGSDDGASEIDLSWTLNLDPTTVSAIEVDRSTSSSGPWTMLTNTLDPNTTIFNDTSNLSENTDYFYQVHAITASGASEEVATTDATTDAAVDTLAATAASTSEIDLTWNLNVTDASAIEVDCSADGGTTWTTVTNSLSGSATGYNDTGLSDNTDYTYRVCAVRPGGNSAYTATADATTTAAIDTVTATPISTGRVDLTWNLNLDPTAVSHIEIDRSDDGGAYTPLTTTLSPSATIYHDTSVSENQNYSYEMRAILTGGGYSSFSDPAAASTAPIQGLSYTSDTADVTLSWTNISTNASAIEVDRSDDGGATWNMLTNTLYGGATGYTDSSLSANTEYLYRVQAIEPAGGAGYTDPEDTWTLPAAPTVVTVTSVTPTEVDLSWTDNASGDAAYYIERSDDGGSTYSIIDMTDPGATTYADTTPADGSSVMYMVAAASGDGLYMNESPPTQSVSLPLIAPTALTATPNGPTEVDLSWAESSQTATGYTIERSTDGLNFSPLPDGTVGYADDTYFSDTTVVAGTQYFYEIVATAGTNSSSPSAIATVASNPSLKAWMGASGEEGSPDALTIQDLYAAGSPDPAAGGWNINWGDGTSTNSADTPGSFNHVYADSGPYTVVASTNNGAYTTTISTFINQEIPTITVTDNLADLGQQSWPGDWNIGAGTTDVDYQLTVASSGEHVVEWIVDWGDGQSQIYSQTSTTPNQTDYTQTFSHDYTVQGPLAVNVSAVYPDDMIGWQKSFTLYSNPWSFDGNGGLNVAGGTGTGPLTGGVAIYYPPQQTDDYTINWGDGTTQTTSLTFVPGSNGVGAQHQYAHAGTYDATVSDSEGDTGGYYITVLANAVPTIATPADQMVAIGQTVNISTTYSGMTVGETPIAYIAWDGITELMTVTPDSSGTSGTLTAQFANPLSLAAESSPTAQIRLFDANDFENYGLISTVPVGAPNAYAQFNIYDWGATIGDGTNNDVLTASPDGTQNLQPVTVYVPCPAGEALDVTLSTSNSLGYDLWQLDPTTGATTLVLGGDTSTYTYTVGPGLAVPEFEMGAVAQATATGTVQLTVGAQINQSLTTALAPMVLATQPVASNTVTSQGTAHVSLSLDNHSAGDPDAMIGTSEFPQDVRGDVDYSVLYLNFPDDLPNGSTITLSVNSDVAQDLDVYQDFASPAIIGHDAGGATSYTWTVQSTVLANNPPQHVYVVGLSGTDYQQVDFTLSLKLAVISPQPASQPTTQLSSSSITANQIATVPGLGGFLEALDGTWGYEGWGNQGIYGLYNQYIKLPGYYGNYQRGVGNKADHPNTPFKGSLLYGLIGDIDAERLVNQAMAAILDFYEAPSHLGIPLDIIGCSRGAFEGAMIADRVEKLDLPIYIRFVGFISPVGQMGPLVQQLSWPNSLPAGVKYYAQALDQTANPGVWNDLAYWQTKITSSPGTVYVEKIFPYSHAGGPKPHSTGRWIRKGTTSIPEVIWTNDPGIEYQKDVIDFLRAQMAIAGVAI